MDVVVTPIDGGRTDASSPTMDVPSDTRRDSGVDTGVDSGVDTGVGDVPTPPPDVASCSVTEAAPDCDTLVPCNAMTFRASCDDSERVRYCEAASGSSTATVRVRFCVGSDVCRQCRDSECSPGYEALCAAP